MSREPSTLQRIGRGLSRFGAGVANPLGTLQFQEQQRQFQQQQLLQQEQERQKQEQLRQLGGILSGQSIPAFKRPGGAEGLTPEAFQQLQRRQLGALGTPEAISALTSQPTGAPLAERRFGLEQQKFALDVRDLQRKEANAKRQEKLLDTLLGGTISEFNLPSVAANTNITQGEDASLNILQQERNKLLPALTVPGAAEIAKAKIKDIDEQIKFQRQLAKETRKQTEKLTPEQAAKVALVSVGIEQLNKAEKLLKTSKGAFDIKSVASMNFKIPFTGAGAGGVPFTQGRNARNLFLNAINAQLRAESGAAVPEEEVSRGFARFIPNVLDSDEGKQTKLDSLRSLLEKTLATAKGPVQQPIIEPVDESEFTGFEVLGVE